MKLQFGQRVGREQVAGTERIYRAAGKFIRREKATVLRVPHPLVCKGGTGFGPMPKNLKRYYGQKHLHFLTWSCYRLKPLLGSARARDCFVKMLDKVRQRYRFRLVGYVKIDPV